MLKLSTVLLHGLLLSSFAIIPLSAAPTSPSAPTPAAPAAPRSPDLSVSDVTQNQQVASRFHFGYYYGRPYYYRPYYYYYPYRPYYYPYNYSNYYYW